MPRTNLSINQDLYDQLKKAADRKNITVNSLIIEELEDKYSKHTRYDYTAALNNMLSEAKEMEGEFTLARLETFADVADVIRQYKMKESAPSVRARLGKLFNEAVRGGAAPGIARAVVIRNGKEEPKCYSRAAVYVNTKKAKKTN